MESAGAELPFEEEGTHATRGVLDEIKQRSINAGTGSIAIKEYAATGIEDAIVRAIQADTYQNGLIHADKFYWNPLELVSFPRFQ